MITDIAAWRAEVLFTGAIVQDDDTSVDVDEAERRCNRYVELLEMVEGTESDEVFLTIIDSMVADEDYEVYQTSFRVAFRFPRDRLGALLFRALRDGYLVRDPDRVGDWLGQLAFLGADSAAVRAFNQAWAEADGDFAAALGRFVLENEQEYGWLAGSDQVGVLRAGRSTAAAVARARDAASTWDIGPSGGAYASLRRFPPDPPTSATDG